MLVLVDQFFILFIVVLKEISDHYFLKLLIIRIEIFYQQSLDKNQDQQVSLPVTLGSRVPECPVFSTRRILLIQATTS
jgi:hypothetical protein